MLLYIVACRERGRAAFSPAEGLGCGVLVVAALVGTALLATGDL